MNIIHQQQPKRKFIQLPVTEHNRPAMYVSKQQLQHQPTHYVYKPTVVTPRIKKVPVLRYVPYTKNNATFAQPVISTSSAIPRYHTIVTANKDSIPIIRAEPMPKRFLQDS